MARLLSLPGVQRLRWVVRRVAPKALILLYHRVSAPDADPQLLCVTPEHFSEHLQILRRYYHPMRLLDLQKRLQLNLWPHRSVVLTFDDGYADNFHQARPLLEAQGIPATVFVASDGVDTQQEFWWDALERIFLSSPTLPANLIIQLGGKELTWKLDDASPSQSQPSWNVLAEISPTARQQAYLDWMKLMRGLDVETRQAILSHLAAWAGVDLTHGRQDYLPVKADELRSLPKDGWIEVGAHTVNHPSLSALSLQAQQDEILAGKTALEKILDRSVRSFAYPFGERRDYTVDTAKLVQQAGFACACSNFTGHVTVLSDPCQLPRFIVRNWDGDTFAQQLEEWFRD